MHLWYEEEFTLYLAQGVTTVRNLWGRRKHLRWARQVEQGKRAGPTLLTTGPILDGAPAIWERSVVVRTEAEARETVARLAREGYRSIKVYNRIRPKVYDALVAACRKQGLKVCGHVPYAVGIERALKARQDSIEHLDGYFGTPWRDYKPKLLKERAARTAAAGTWNCPTLMVYTRFVPAATGKRLLQSPEMRFVPPRLRATWDPSRDFRLKNLGPSTFRRIARHVEWERSLVKWLHDAGAPLLVGTDAGNPFVVAGWSVHLELAEFVKSGLTPYETLVAATRAPGRFAGEDFGTITVGQRADLLLIKNNPLKDVAHCKSPDGVMARGRWWTRKQLDAMLTEVAASYKRKKQRFKGLEALPRGRRLSWTVRWNGLVVGEERATLSDAWLVAQRVNDAPWSSVRRARYEFDAKGAITGAGIRWNDDEESRTRAFDPTQINGDAGLALWIVLARRFWHLKVGEEWREKHRRPSADLSEFEQFPLIVRRLKGADGRRCFRVVEKRRDKTYASTLWFEGAVPSRLRTELQQGTIEIRLER